MRAKRPPFWLQCVLKLSYEFLIEIAVILLANHNKTRQSHKPVTMHMRTKRGKIPASKACFDTDWLNIWREIFCQSINAELGSQNNREFPWEFRFKLCWWQYRSFPCIHSNCVAFVLLKWQRLCVELSCSWVAFGLKAATLKPKRMLPDSHNLNKFKFSLQSTLKSFVKTWHL